MALSEKWVLEKARSLLWNPDYTGFNPVAFARAIEAEVRKDDEALIRQLVEALETCDESDGYTGLRQFFDDKAVEAAITARRAGGACPQSRGSD